MDSKKSKRGRAKSFGGHTSGTSRSKKSRNMDDTEQEERDRIEAANVLSSLRFFAPKSQDSISPVSTVQAVDHERNFPVTHKMSDPKYGNPTSLSAAPPVQDSKPEIRYLPVARGSGRGPSPAPQGGVVLSEQANKFILMHLYNSLQNRQGKSELQTSPNDESRIPSNLPSESIIPKSEAARKVMSVNINRTSSLPNILHPTNPVNRAVAAALRNAIPASARERSQKQSDTIRDTTANLTSKVPDRHLANRIPVQTGLEKDSVCGMKDSKSFVTLDSDIQNSKKMDSTENSLPLKKRRVFPQQGARSDSPVSVEVVAAPHLDYDSQTDVKNLLRLAQTTQMTSMISETPSHKTYTGDGYKPIDPSATLRVLSDVKQALTPDEDGDLPLHIAVVHQNNELVKRFVDIMTMSGKSVDRYNKLMQTPLHLAVLVRQTDIIVTLLSAGSDPNLVDRNGCTAMHIAVEKGFHECLEAILEYSRYECDLCTRNFEGYTPLHTTVEQNDMNMMVSLIKHGANIDGQDGKAGRSVIYYAVEYDRVSMFYYLHEQGANIEQPNYAGITPGLAAQSTNQQKIIDIIGKGTEDAKSSDDMALNMSKKLPLPRIPSKAALIVPEVPMFGLSRSNSVEDVKQAPKLRRLSSSTPVDLSLNSAAKAEKTSSPDSPPILKPRNIPKPKYKSAKLVEKHAVLVEQLQSKDKADLQSYANLPPEKLKAMFAAMNANAALGKEELISQANEVEKHKHAPKQKMEMSVPYFSTDKQTIKRVDNDDHYSLLQKIKRSNQDTEALLGLILDSDLKRKLVKLREGQSYGPEQMISIRKHLASSVTTSSAKFSQNKLNENKLVSQRKPSYSQNTVSDKMEIDKPDIPNADTESQNTPILSGFVAMKTIRSENTTSRLSGNKTDDEELEDESDLKLSQGFDTKDYEGSGVKKKGSDRSISAQEILCSEKKHADDSLEGKNIDAKLDNLDKTQEDLEKDETSSVEVQGDILSLDEDVEEHALVIDEKSGDDKSIKTKLTLHSYESDESTDSADTDKLENFAESDVTYEAEEHIYGSKLEQKSLLKSGSKKEGDKSSGIETVMGSSEVSEHKQSSKYIALGYSCSGNEIASTSDGSTCKAQNKSIVSDSYGNLSGEKKKIDKHVQEESRSSQPQIRATNFCENKTFKNFNEEMMCQVHEETDWETVSLATCTPPPLAKFDQIIKLDRQTAKHTESNDTSPPRLSKCAEDVLAMRQSDKNTENIVSVSSSSSALLDQDKMTVSDKDKHIDLNHESTELVSLVRTANSLSQSSENGSELGFEAERSIDTSVNKITLPSLNKVDGKTEEKSAELVKSKDCIEKESLQEGEENLIKMVHDQSHENLRQDSINLSDAEKSTDAELSKQNKETMVKESQTHIGQTEDSVGKERYTQESADVKHMNVAKAHTLYFFDGSTYRSVKVYIDDNEASSEQFKRMFSEKLNKGPGQTSIMLGPGQSPVPRTRKRLSETVTSNDNNSSSESAKVINYANVRENSAVKEIRTMRSASDSTDKTLPVISFSTSRPGSKPDAISSGSKYIELKKTNSGNTDDTKSSVTSNERSSSNTNSVTVLNNSSVVHPNTSDMNLTSVVEHHSFQLPSLSGTHNNTVQDLSKKMNKNLPNPTVTQTPLKPTTSSQSVSVPRVLGMSTGKSSVTTSEGTITRINPDIKSKLSKALQSPSRKLNIIKTDPNEKVFPPPSLSETPVTKETSLRLQI